MSPPSEARRPIRRLDPATVGRIAAGEVVERPASVVKELVENAYDASAREVRVSVEGGGLARIVVSDDGVGIPAAELPLAVERHATSKLDDAEGLAAIGTLGFRGEALAAIAAAARLTLSSRVAAEESASGIVVEGGELTRRVEIAAPPGTTVEVRDLFYATPARRKFLRAPAAELLEITQTVGALYLARPEVALSLASEGREIARYPPSRTLADAVVRVLGEELLDRLVLVEVPEAGGIAIHAALGRPDRSRGNSRGLQIAVNGRSVAAKALLQSVRLAYEDYLPKWRFPIGAVHLEIDPAAVDVNVHPTKREIRFASEREVAERLRRAVRAALVAAPRVAEPPERRRAPVVGPTMPLDPEGADGPVALDPPKVPLLPRSLASASVVQRTLVAGPPELAVAGAGGRPRLSLRSPALFALYWVAEADGALLLVDQHAASERLTYESLRAEGHLPRQALVQPLLLKLTAARATALAGFREVVRSGGFEVEPFGDDHVRLLTVPALRGRWPSAETFVELLDELAEGGRPTVVGSIADRTAASVACHASVRAGDLIGVEEVARMLDRLDRLPESAYACPHGRPITMRLPRSRIDRWFLRSPA